ncbi:MAG: RnfABCDGE type electron transport complex subunit B [Gammaproteobacteria bacterium]|nr:RnfABCDGE type electron transport complex subunit B [Gammaproteobacteria bacterium]MBT8152210.1 RnfABCDGE type electron transport complex subunit B [Gammaproteobacteria bacterium]
MIVVTAVLTLGGITFLLATALILANRKLHVEEDFRIDEVEAMLPHTNCGACGYPGCRPFAEALVSGAALPSQCSVSNAQGRETIADYLGVAVGEQTRMVARLACAGGSNVARNRAHYQGNPSCLAAAQVAGGGKGCHWGCLGFGDCERVCDFNAIAMNAHGLPVVDSDQCTACGDCVEICPKDLFSLQPVNSHLWVACKNQERGDEVLAECEVACTACERCAFDAPAGLIRMQDNLPVIDYSRRQDTRVPIERCPTGAIVWIDEREGVIKGAASRKVLRHSALPEAPS